MIVSYQPNQPCSLALPAGLCKILPQEDKELSQENIKTQEVEEMNETREEGCENERRGL